MIKLGKSLVITLIIIIILAAFVLMMSSREEGRIKQPILGNNESITIEPGVTNVKSFSDAKKISTNMINKTSSSSRPVATRTPKPLPYPRISINYSMEKMSSIRGNSVDRNSTFIIVMLDIRNYGYRYFDAHPSRFRIGQSADIVPLINITTGDIIDDVIVNNSRAKGGLVFLLDKKKYPGKVTYLLTNKSESYTILYKKVSPSEIEDQNQGATNDEDY